MASHPRRPYRAAAPGHPGRRDFLRGALGLGLMSLLEGGSPLFAQGARPRALPLQGGGKGRNPKTRFLIVLHGSGGASIIDSFLALTEAQVTAAGGDAATLNCFTDAQAVAIADSPFRAVNYDGVVATLGNLPVKSDQESFAKKHKQDMLAVTLQGTSITHPTAQKRSITGNEAWSGRTLQEACAAAYGDGLPIPNLLLGSGGYAEPGVDSSLPAFARGLAVSDSRYWSSGLSSTFGLGDAPSAELVQIARDVRDQLADRDSNFFKTFKDSPLLQEWVEARGATRERYDAASLAPGLAISGPAAAELRELFPSYLTDDFEAQAILACLAITQDVACTVTMGPSFSVVGQGGLANIKNPPIAFDFSHADHRGIQAMMWQRILSVMSRMSDYLRKHEFGAGESFWDRTAVYFATDFGRSRRRPANSQAFSSGHDLNNGVLIVSPMAKGNTVLGGVDAKTTNTFGFDPRTGTPSPQRNTEEKELYCGILQMLGIDTKDIPGATDMRAMRRKA